MLTFRCLHSNGVCFSPRAKGCPGSLLCQITVRARLRFQLVLLLWQWDLPLADLITLVAPMLGRLTITALHRSPALGVPMGRPLTRLYSTGQVWAASLGCSRIMGMDPVAMAEGERCELLFASMDVWKVSVSLQAQCLPYGQIDTVRAHGIRFWNWLHVAMDIIWQRCM